MTGLRRASLLVGCCLGLLAGCNKNTDNALPVVGEVNVSDPRATALFAEAQAAAAAGNNKAALKLYEETAHKYPSSDVAPEARFRQAALLESDGELLDAFDAYQQVIQRYPSTPLYAQARTRQAVVAHAAADGVIKNSVLGIKSRLDSKKIVEMLEKVRDNAPYADSAPKAQFTIGEVLAQRKKDIPAIAAFQKVVDDYPRSGYAPEAQYRIGDILLTSAERGNQNQANLDRARHTFEDLIQTYPGSPRAADARKKVTEISGRDVQRSFDIAEFYLGKGQTSSAAYYYNEVLRKTSGGQLHQQAQRHLQEINASATE